MQRATFFLRRAFGLFDVHEKKMPSFEIFSQCVQDVFNADRHRSCNCDFSWSSKKTVFLCDRLDNFFSFLVSKWVSLAPPTLGIHEQPHSFPPMYRYTTLKSLPLHCSSFSAASYTSLAFSASSNLASASLAATIASLKSFFINEIPNPPA